MEQINQILEFLKNAKTYYLATINNGLPDVRPFGTINLFENKLYIQTGRKKDVYKQMKANENINICAFYNGEWIRINAKAVEDDRIEPQIDMLKSYPELSNMYKPGDGNNVVFYLSKIEAKICGFTHEPIVIKL